MSRTRRRVALLLLLAALVLVGGATGAAADPGDVGVEGPSHAATATPTGTKRAASVVWFNDGRWWANMWDTDTADFHIFRLRSDGRAWVDTGVRTESRSNTHHDVLWNGSTLYVASHRVVPDGSDAVAGSPSVLRRYSYNSVTGTYSRLGSSEINGLRTETLSIDQDATGRIWATWQQGGAIWLNVTDTDGATWGRPFPHPAFADAAQPAGVSADDTSALVSFGPHSVGLMWTRQAGDAADGFYWSVHRDGDAATAWSPPTDVWTGPRVGDDHVSLAAVEEDVVAVVKTSLPGATSPLVALLLRDPAGGWARHTVATGAECANHAIAVLDAEARRVRTFATYPKPPGTDGAGICSSSGGGVYEKSTPLDGISFTPDKTLRVLDADQYLHNVSSVKQSAASTSGRAAGGGLVLLADVHVTARYWHHHEPGAASGAPVGATAAEAPGPGERAEQASDRRSDERTGRGGWIGTVLLTTGLVALTSWSLVASGALGRRW